MKSPIFSRIDKARRPLNLEQQLLAAHRGAKIEISIDEIRQKGLVRALLERANQ